MRLFACMVVLFLSGVSAKEECLIVDIKDASSLNLQASANTTGVEARLIDKVTVRANNQEEFGQECAEVCCQNELCNIAEVSFETAEDTCQLIRCVPAEKCIWQANNDTVSIVMQKQQLTSTGSSAAPTVAKDIAANSATPSGKATTAGGKIPSSTVPSTQPVGMSATSANRTATTEQTSTSQTSSKGQISTTKGQETTNHLSTAATTQQKQSTLPTNSTASIVTDNNTVPQPTTQEMTSSNATAKVTSAATNTISTENNQTMSSTPSSAPAANSTTLTTTNTTATGPFNATAGPMKGPGVDKLSPYSLAAIFGTSITVSLLVVFIVSHRFYESWKRRHYKQINA